MEEQSVNHLFLFILGFMNGNVLLLVHVGDRVSHKIIAGTCPYQSILSALGTDVFMCPWIERRYINCNAFENWTKTFFFIQMVEKGTEILSFWSHSSEKCPVHVP